MYLLQHITHSSSTFVWLSANRNCKLKTHDYKLFLSHILLDRSIIMFVMLMKLQCSK